MNSELHEFKKKKCNYGKNEKGQQKRGRPKSGETGNVFIEDANKRAQCLYQRKTTMFKKAKEINTTTKAEVVVMIKPESGKTSHWCTPYYEEFCKSVNSSLPSSSSDPNLTKTSTSNSPPAPLLNSNVTQISTANISPALLSSDSDNDCNFPSPSQHYPSPQPSTSFSSPPPSKRRRTTTSTREGKKLVNKSTQTSAIITGLEKQCNVCLSSEENGYWVGCDHKSKKCNYCVHDKCLGFSFKTKAELKKVVYKCPAHM